MTASASDKVLVDSLLSLARLPIDEEEYARLLRTYPLLREQANALRLPETRNAAPADIYSALDHP
jgi:hypothetical protein